MIDSDVRNPCGYNLKTGTTSPRFFLGIIMTLQAGFGGNNNNIATLMPKLFLGTVLQGPVGAKQGAWPK